MSQLTLFIARASKPQASAQLPLEEVGETGERIDAHDARASATKFDSALMS